MRQEWLSGPLLFALAAAGLVGCGDASVSSQSHDILANFDAADGQFLGDAACTTDKQCDDGDPCSKSACKNGTCVVVSECSDCPCDDGNPCTIHDDCGGAHNCFGGGKLDCDDKNPCTTDTCDPNSGCVYATNDGSPCDDGDGCTQNDACKAGKCGTGGALSCDDGNPCTTDTCSPASGCAFTNNSDPCSDGNLCTTSDQCSGGKCQPGTPRVCSDNNACTDDKCDVKSGNCLFLPNAVPCDDGNSLTSGDACSAGQCIGQFGCGCATDAECDDKNPCTKDVCATSGSVGGGCCVNAALPGPVTCSDGNSCTQNDLCDGGSCIAGAKLGCDDGNICTDDACLPDIGCSHTANSVKCDDGLACSVGDVCKSGACTAVLSDCPCTSDAMCSDGNACTDDACVNGKCATKPSGAGKACEDGNACTTGDACLSGVCLPGALTPCDDGNACTNDACDPGDGSCVHTANFSLCWDGDNCTTPDKCSGGVCNSGPAIVCDDQNPCTQDACSQSSAAFTCIYTFSSGPCDDGNVCTTGDTCLGGACTGVATGACADDNPCTDDGCATDASGAKVCAHAAIIGPCDDGNPCTNGDACAGVTCAGAPTTCDDQNPCTSDVCDAVGACQHTATAGSCSDGNTCTVGDACAGGVCAPGPSDPCDDKDGCTADSCDPVGGCSHTAKGDGATCLNAACDGLVHSGAGTCLGGVCIPGASIPCDDANVCTDDTCDPAGGCGHANNTASCSDGNLCTTGDACGGGTCLPGAASSCDDGNLCSVDACDPSQGCEHSAATDGTQCATSGCSALVLGFGGVCHTGACELTAAPVNCDDGNPCTDDFCSPGSGCSHQANTVGCSDGNLCTVDDACALGKCLGGTAPSCSDNNPCTDDACSPATGCTHMPGSDGKPCDDGSVCTSNDLCGGGVCVPGASAVCDDKNPCTTDACDAKSGCSYANNTAACDDGSPCTTGDICSGGKCGAVNKPCDDDNPCTSDGCDGLGGCTHTILGDGAACSTTLCSGLSFQAAATCQAGVCGSKPAPTSCNDGNSCTDDLCNAGSGCLHPNNGAACDDGNACTTGDTCAFGACAGTTTLCDAGGACTQGTGCNAVTGCQYKPLTGTPCSDGNACTLNDTCAAGTCNPGSQVSCDDKNACTADACDAVKGCAWTALSSGACSDGNVCTGDDACVGGVCVGGLAVSCDDQNPCTNDSCDPTAGCKTSNNTANCQDGNKCTVGDACSGGTCQPGPALLCDDGNPCTSDGCDPIAGCTTAKVANGTSCGSGACSGLKFTAPATCTSGQCIAPAVKSCDDGIECTADACDATAGCSNPNKPWGTACTPANTMLLMPFCAESLCTGFEVKVGDVGTTTSGALTGIDRSGSGLFASGGDTSFANGQGQGDVRGVSQTPLALSNAGLYSVPKSHMNDIRAVLAVGGIGTNVAAFMVQGAMGFVPQLVSASASFSRALNAVDSFPGSNGDTYVFGGGSNSTAELQTNVGLTTLAGSAFGTVSRIVVATSPTQCALQVPMTVNDVYAASNNAIYFAGFIGKNGQSPTQSAVAVWDGSLANSCDGLDFKYAGEAYTNAPTSSVDRVVAISSGLGQGSYRTIHGTSAAHLLVGGTLGTLWSFDNDAWTQQTPVVAGPTAWSTQFDVKSVWLDGSEAWATGEFYGPSGASASCRQVFMLHGLFDAMTSLWSWNQLALPGLSDCGATIANTQANKIWRDATSNAVFIVGSWGGQELVARVQLP